MSDRKGAKRELTRLATTVDADNRWLSTQVSNRPDLATRSISSEVEVSSPSRISRASSTPSHAVGIVGSPNWRPNSQSGWPNVHPGSEISSMYYYVA